MIATAGQSDSITGQLIRASIEAAKLELGLGDTLFQHNFKTVGHLLTPCWIKHSWQFMHKFNIAMMEGTPTLLLLRISDKYLVEHFLLNSFTGATLACLN